MSHRNQLLRVVRWNGNTQRKGKEKMADKQKSCTCNVPSAIKALENLIKTFESKRGTGWDVGTFIDDQIASLNSSIANLRRELN